MYRKLITFVALLLAFCVPSWAGPKVVILVVGSTSLRDLDSGQYPHFRKLLNNASIGLMNVRTAGNVTDEPSTTGFEAACLTIGAGTRAVGGYDVRKAYDAGDEISYLTAADIWSARTLLPKTDARVIQPSAAGISAFNSLEKHTIAVGGLGQAVRDSGRKTAVIGNSDTPEELHREVVGLTMDRNGLVDLGDVGDSLSKRDPKAPFGLAADHEAYIQSLDALWARTDLIAIDAGDTLRAVTYGMNCTPEQAEKLKTWAFRRTDDLLGALMVRVDPRRDMLVVLSPNLAKESLKEGQLLAPAAVWGPGFGPGLLVSSSTRGTGIITNADIAPTVLGFFDIKAPSAMLGRPIASIRTSGALERLTSMESRLVLRNRQQPISRWIAVACTVLVLITTLGFLSGRWSVLSSRAALLPSSFMVSALYAPLFGMRDLWPTVLTIAVLSIALTVLSLAVWRKPVKAFAFFCFMLCVGLGLDLLWGLGLLRQSVLSYSVSEGARYYGLGNEYMGALIGASVVGTGIFLSRAGLSSKAGKIIAASAFFLTAFVIASPFLGANTGGTMSIIPTALAALRLRAGKGIRAAHAGGIILAVVLAVCLLVAVDGMFGNGQSHIGRFGADVSSGGAGQFLMVIERKLAMNIMLLSKSLWSRLMTAAAAAILLLWMLPQSRTQSAVRRSPELYAAFLASLVGAASALVFNDSGVVAAAICLIYPWTAAVLANGCEKGLVPAHK